MGTSRIIPVSKWLVTPIYKSFNSAIWKGSRNPESSLTMVTDHLLNGMILQVLAAKVSIKCPEQIAYSWIESLPYTQLLRNKRVS